MYNFDELTQRRGTGSYKWDSDPETGEMSLTQAAGEPMIPLWVADMDFRTAPCITEALGKRVDSGIFGYVKVPDSYYEALGEWFRSRHGWEISRESVIYTSGVVPALSAIIKALVKPGEGVILHTPAYNCFFSSIRNNGCLPVASPLQRKELEDGFTYEIDFEGLEKLASRPENRMLILCNPHNPTGRVWTRRELELTREICRRHGVTVVSDEIHCELTHPGYEYIPYLTVDGEAVACCSPSKAFNIAGLQIANIIAPLTDMRKAIDRAININEVCDVNPFGVIALQEAYRNGADWLSALNEYLYANYLFLRSFLRRRMPMLRICDSESTYLAWIDIRALGMTADEVEERGKRYGVWVNAGTLYGGQGYIRINYACPRKRLEEGLERLCSALTSGS